MKIPKVTGMIDRRILVNYVADPKVLQKLIPRNFQLKLVNGLGVAGICLIRLKHERLKGLPQMLGSGSENAALRIAVEWQENGKSCHGVYIPRRETSSRLNALIGGRLFPGKHYHARFAVAEEGTCHNIAFKSSDGLSFDLKASCSDAQSGAKSIFRSLADASEFFRAGFVGYSPNADGTQLERLRLKTYDWAMSCLDVHELHFSLMADRSVFPEGSVRFDSAFLMKQIAHDWIDEGKVVLKPSN